MTQKLPLCGAVDYPYMSGGAPCRYRRCWETCSGSDMRTAASSVWSSLSSHVSWPYCSLPSGEGYKYTVQYLKDYCSYSMYYVGSTRNTRSSFSQRLLSCILVHFSLQFKCTLHHPLPVVRTKTNSLANHKLSLTYQLKEVSSEWLHSFEIQDFSPSKILTLNIKKSKTVLDWFKSHRHTVKTCQEYLSVHRVSLFPVIVSIREHGFSFVRLDGTMSQKKRAQVIKDFQSADADSPTIMLLSLKAGGVGLNLTAASHVFLMDPVSTSF